MQESHLFHLLANLRRSCIMVLPTERIVLVAIAVLRGLAADWAMANWAASFDLVVQAATAAEESVVVQLSAVAARLVAIKNCSTTGGN